MPAVASRTESSRSNSRPRGVDRIHVPAPRAVPPATGYAPSPDEEYMGPRQLAHFKAKLASQYAVLVAEVQAAAHDAAGNGGHHDPGDDADHAASIADAEAALRASARRRSQMAAISAALRRIETGEYGFCEETGEPIGLARLEIQPTAVLSVDAQERRELHGRAFAQAPAL